jgi:hypothetical protein
MIITVKIKPWLKEFLECKFGDPIPAERHSLIGFIVSPLLEYTPKDYFPPAIPADESLNIDVPRDLSRSAGRTDLGNVYISDFNQKLLENGVAALFKDELVNYMNDKIRYEGKHRSSNLKDCIYQFCIDYNISFNAIQYENLKKMYYRHRKKQEILRKSRRNLSLMKPLFIL